MKVRKIAKSRQPKPVNRWFRVVEIDDCGITLMPTKKRQNSSSQTKFLESNYSVGLALKLNMSQLLKNYSGRENQNITG